MIRDRKHLGPAAIPALADAKDLDLQEIVDFIDDLFQLLNLIIETMRNIGNYLSGE